MHTPLRIVEQDKSQDWRLMAEAIQATEFPYSEVDLQLEDIGSLIALLFFSQKFKRKIIKSAQHSTFTNTRTNTHTQYAH